MHDGVGLRCRKLHRRGRGQPESGQISGAMLPNGEPVNYVPGTNIQSDEAELFDDILRLQKPDCRSLVEELKERMTDTEILYAYGYPVAGKDQSRFEEALQAVREADAVILTLGGKHGTCSMATMGEGVDAADINLPECQDAFIQAAAACGKPLIGVHFDGRPISSDTADQYLDAIIEAWNRRKRERRLWRMSCWGHITRAVSCRYPWHITPDRFQFIIITRTVLHGTSRRVSDLSTMWIFPIHRDIASGMDCLIHGLSIQKFIYRQQRLEQKNRYRLAVW